MAGEKSVLSGEEGQKITKRLLELCGWNIAEHIDFDCSNGAKHKLKTSKGDRQQHSIDGIQSYLNPLNHAIKNVILISAKHHASDYPSASKSKLNKTSKELAQAIECAKESSEIAEHYIVDDDSGRSIEYNGLITFLSSSLDEKHTSFFKESGHELSIPTDNFDALFFIDNKRATFLYSSISEALRYSDDNLVSYIYPDTGTNHEHQHLNLAGRLLPLELMCSDVLPILVQKSGDNHVLIFCNDRIDDKYLKRIIWLAHRICGFASRTTIYFPNYNTTDHDRMVKTVMQAFQTSNYINKISISKWDDLSFIKLKEDSGIYQDSTKTPGSFPLNDRVDAITRISEDYDKILPFGAMVKPILSSSMLSATDLKDFLKRKGVFVKYADKEAIIPIFSGMLLSPIELDFLKGMLVDKEEKPKSLNKSAAFFGTLEQLKEVVQSIPLQQIILRQNCKHLNSPRFIRKADDRYELEVDIERTNTSKDLISGKTRHTARLTVLVESGRINVKTEFSSFETKSYLESVATALNVKLKEAKCIQKDLRSVQFRDFQSNSDRVLFLTGLKDITYSDHFFNGEIVNIKFKPDETIHNLPNELNSYRGKVKNLDINGNLLEELPHIEHPDYQNAILLSRVKIKFGFSVDGNSGYCLAEIDFPSTLNGNEVDGNTDMVVSVEILKSKDSNITGNIPRLQNRLSRLLDQIVLSRYNSGTYAVTN